MPFDLQLFRVCGIVWLGFVGLALAGSGRDAFHWIGARFHEVRLRFNFLRRSPQVVPGRVEVDPYQSPAVEPEPVKLLPPQELGQPLPEVPQLPPKVLRRFTQ
jgi:hypothetical protein